jgi:hypothetical protein
MLKCLAVLGLLAAVAPIVSGQPNKTTDQKQETTKQSQPAALPTDSKDKQASGQTDQPEAGADSPKWYTPFERPDWWLVIVAALTGGVICWQSVETRKAAQGAFLNAQAVINAERPWMLISVKSSPGEMGGFDVRIRNRGRTPAMVTEARMGCVAVNKVSDLPLPAVFPMDNPIKNKVIIPGGRAHIVWFDQRLFKALLGDDLPQSSSQKQIFVHGKVLYRDLANPDRSVIHETRWIGLYQFPSEDDEGNSIFRIEGIGVSDEYDRYS